MNPRPPSVNIDDVITTRLVIMRSRLRGRSLLHVFGPEAEPYQAAREMSKNRPPRDAPHEGGRLISLSVARCFTSASGALHHQLHFLRRFRRERPPRLDRG